MMHNCLAENTTNLSHLSCQTIIETLSPSWSQTRSMKNLVMYCGIIAEGRKALGVTVIPCVSPADVIDAGECRKDQTLGNGTQRWHQELRETGLLANSLRSLLCRNQESYCQHGCHRWVPFPSVWSFRHCPASITSAGEVQGIRGHRP